MLQEKIDLILSIITWIFGKEKIDLNQYQEIPNDWNLYDIIMNQNTERASTSL